jgi:GTPase
MSSKASVVIVGRMNVGKSTLFNRISLRVKSITLDYEGVTRDYIKEEVMWKGIPFDLIDSGGIHLRKSQDELFEKVRKKVLALVEDADVIIFMVDGTVGLIPEDREIATYLHKTGKPVVLAINKIDSKQAQEFRYEFDQLGFDKSVELSAEHGRGVEDLLDDVLSLMPLQVSHKEAEEPSFRVMLLGKPNVGKSSLMNALLKEERSLVSAEAGTTREAFSEEIMFYKEAIQITDTPGIRRKRAVSGGGELEPLMVQSAFHALKKSHIILLLIDGSSHTMVDQELKLAFYAFTEQYKACILVINKSDLITEQSAKDLERCFEMYQHLMKKISVINISCKTDKNVGKVLPLIQKVWERYSQKLDDTALTKLFKEKLAKKPLYAKTKLLHVYKVKQIRTAPITIELRVNEPLWFGDSQLNFFENLLRSEYDMVGVPVKFTVKKS